MVIESNFHYFKRMKTIDYYNQFADEFALATLYVDMESIYQPFLAELPDSARILDLGCGSGRDTLAFKNRGYQVDAIDYSEVLVERATQLTGIAVQLQSFYEVDIHDVYDGIWACASLLHCDRNRLPDVLKRIHAALRRGGICYMSFKYGSADRVKGGRVFTDLNEEQAQELLDQLEGGRVLKQWVTEDQRADRQEKWLNLLWKNMPDFIPTAKEQLKFLKNIQLILQSGSFSSTYKFALLISLSRLAIEKGEDTSACLTLEYTNISEKFIELYWKQAVPYTFNDEGQLILNQNNGKQAAIVNRIIELRQIYSSLGLLRRDSLVWLKLVKDVARTVKEMPVRYLQNINGQNFEFIYQLDQCKKQLILLPQVMFCLRQFSAIIEELCQKRWIDYIRKNSSNAPILNQLPNLEQFMFEPSRNQLNAVANVLLELQDCKCFYCNKPMKKGNYAVDHFIPWSMYPSDTGHNFVLADSNCNSKKSNLLASNHFLHKWQERNEEQDLIIVDRISVLGFLTDKERSHKVAEWAYAQGRENNYIFWE